MARPNDGRVAPEQRRTTGVPAPPRESGTARIAVDLLGGDHAPAVVVDGALRACQADPSLHLLLVGPHDVAGAILAALGPEQSGRVSTLAVPAGEIEPPGGAPPAGPVRHGAQVPAGRGETWADAGVRAAVRAITEGRADAAVSAGNTAATVTAAALSLGRWPGVRRPPLAAVLPTVAGRLVLLDVGSSLDPDKSTLAMHARMGAAYAAVVHEVVAPRVGLLTIGSERGKGDRLRRALPPLFATLELPAGARYTGLVEGHDVVLGDAADVVVTDGFTGNVLLKGLETAYARLGSPAGAAGEVPPRAALLLGVGGTVVVCHGAATGPDLAAGIALAAQLHRRAAVAAIAELIPHNEVSHD